MQHEAVKTEAMLESGPGSPRSQADKAVVIPRDSNNIGSGTVVQEALHHHAQRLQRGKVSFAVEPSSRPSTYQPVTSKRSRVTFAVADGDSDQHTASPVLQSSASQPKHAEDDSGSDDSASSDEQRETDAAHVQSVGFGRGLLERAQRSFTDKTKLQQQLSSGTGAAGKPQHGSSSQAANAAAPLDQDDEEADSSTPISRHHSVASSFTASLRGLLGGASTRLLSSIMGRNSISSKESHDEEQKEELWFTSLDDFKPICHMLHKGRYMSAYFACANRTGQHFLLKKYDKHKMVPAEERGVRRSIAFSELLRHANLVKCVGQWEAEDIIYVVEEYAGKGDVFNDAISHPEKYTERYVAVYLVKPLLQVLAHLHANNIIHRSVLPENLYMAIDDVLKLGHLTLAVDQLSDRPKSRTALLDYMAPEMLSVKPHNEHELAHLMDDSSEDEEENLYEQQQQQQQQTASGLIANQPCASPGLYTQQGQQPQHSLQRQPWEEVSTPGRPLTAVGNEQQLHAKQQLAAEASSSTVATAASRSSSRARLRARGCVAGGQAEWEYLDYYDEKVDIWQVGCLVHELLCGSMPFEVASKVDSAGLALWADIEQPPGSLPPDCVQFLQQALTKDPKQRPSAADLMQHPWLTRCESGEPWRDPIELEAAKKAAELATVSGWLRHHSRVVASGVAGLVQGLLHGNRVQPIESVGDFQPQQQQVMGLPSTPGKQWVSSTSSAMEASSSADIAPAPASSNHWQTSSRAGTHCQQEQAQQEPCSTQQQWHAGADAVMPVRMQDEGLDGSGEQHGLSSPVKLTAELINRLNADWHTGSNRQDSEVSTDEDDLQHMQAACIVMASARHTSDSCSAGVTAVANKVSGASARPLTPQHQQQQQLIL